MQEGRAADGGAKSLSGSVCNSLLYSLEFGNEVGLNKQSPRERSWSSVVE